MHAPTLALLVALALAGAAAAGSAENPEISDPAGDAGTPGNEVADILAAWFEDDAEQVRLTISVAKLQNPPGGTGWAVLFDLAGRSLWMGAYSDLTLNSDAASSGPALVPSWGEWDRGKHIPLTFESADGSVTEGAPGTVAVQVPKSALAGLVGDIPEGTALTSLAASGGNGMQLNLALVSVPEEPIYREWDSATGVDFPLSAGVPSPFVPKPNPTAGNVTAAETDPGEGRTVPFPVLAALAGALVAARRRP